jgi:hypothetical protein
MACGGSSSWKHPASTRGLAFGLIFLWLFTVSWISLHGRLVPAMPALTMMEPMHQPIIKQDKTSNTNSSSVPSTNTRRLSFLHIPKTAGSSIEKMAAEQGLHWGRCFYKKCDYGEDFQLDPSINQSTAKWLSNLGLKCNTWYHLPIQHLPQGVPNPYDEENKDVFVVMRNPYDRIISDFYFVCGNTRNCEKDKVKRSKRIQQPIFMNQWIQKRLGPLAKNCPELLGKKVPSSFSSCYYQYCGHYIPQSHYVYNDDHKKMVAHILHFESIQDELAGLMQAYSSAHHHHHLSLKDHYSIHRNNPRETRLNRTSLSKDTIQLINHIYHKDFGIGGYTMMLSSLDSSS